MKYSHSPAWSMAGKVKGTVSTHQGGRQETAPGPAAYSPDKIVPTVTPTWKIGTSTRPDLAQCDKSVPGPGFYNPKQKYHIISGSKFHAKTYETKDRLNQTTPGPGQYSPCSSKFKRFYGGYYMASKNIRTEKGADIPGPGSYDPFRSSLAKQSIKIGYEKRLFDYESKVPGPGAYNVSRPLTAGANGPRAVFSREGRMKITGMDTSDIGRKDEIDSAGQYNFESSFAHADKKGYSISGKTELKSTQVVPGPGAYSPRSIDKPTSPVITMGMRTQTLSSKMQETPGPGQYLKTEPNGIYASRYCKIGTEERRPLMEDTGTPGPAAYTIPVKIEGPKYSLHGTKEFKSNEKIPGPGDYEPRVDYVRTRPTSAKIGNSKRNETKTSMAPGPGSYNYKDSVEGPSWGFGKSMRNGGSNPSQPGPGQYEIPSTIAQVASYAMGRSTSSKYMSK